MKRIIVLINFLTLLFFAQAQEKVTYQLNGKTIEFNISQEEMYVEFAENQKSAIQRISKDGFEEISGKSAILKMPELKGTFNKRKQKFKGKTSQNFQRIEPVLIYNDGTKQIAKGELNIKLKADTSLKDLLKGKTFTLQPNEFENNLYLVRLNLETSDLFELVNQLQDDNRVEFAEPNFIRMMKTHTNDPFFSSQWAINNQGYLGGTIDADMDVDDAWNYATGSGIKVAVIDEGVDLSHPDLTPNLLNGYDATGNGSNGAPNESNNDAHGTACAGIIAGVGNNNTGIAGVAYNAKIIPIRIAFSNGLFWTTNDNWIANGINWAWQNGADVLSNSYGGGSYSITIESAINNAVNNGRNGKGSVVLFSSGNDPGGNGDPVSFPATVASAISVGASSMCDTRKNLSSCDGEFWGSNFGNSLDVVAPGVKIYTTDISGSAGYNSGDYKSDFNGTSSACPNAAGVVALILSANPNLTQHQARDILERNTDKVSGYIYSNNSSQPNGTWNSEVGYGRINARKAVEDILVGNVSITGGTSISCSTSNIITFNLSGLSSSTIPVTWTKSSNLQIINSSNTGITVSPTSLSGSAYVRASIGGTSFTKSFWLGLPIVNLTTDIPYFNAVRVIVNGGSNYSISQQGITNIDFQKISGNGVLTDASYFTIGQYPTTWSIYGKATAYNACGSNYSTFNIAWNSSNNGGGTRPPAWLSNNASLNEFSVFPNPVAEELHINFGELFVENDENSIIISNLTGKKVYYSKITNQYSSINIRMLPSGIYILKATNGSEFKTEKLIVK